MRVEEKGEIIKRLRENVDLNIPDANSRERGYYIRGAVDTMALVPTTDDAREKALADERNRTSSAEERGYEVGILLSARNLIKNGMTIEEVSKHTDYSPAELEQLFQDEEVISRANQYSSSFEDEWNRQMREASEQTLETKLSAINSKIQEFEGEKARILLMLEDDEPVDGIFAVPPTPGEPRVKLRLLLDYCKQVNKEPSELTPEELEPFLDHTKIKGCSDCH